MADSPQVQIPRVIAGVDVTALPLGPEEGFVLSCIDGQSHVGEIGDVTGLGRDRVTEVIGALIERGVAEWAALGRSQRPLYAAEELDEANVDLDRERRKVILNAYYRLDDMTLYEVLEVEPDAERAAIRAAYFRLSKTFHPDTLFGKSLGSYKAKMETVFKRLTEAYDVLGKRRSREEYDAYMQVRERTRAAQASLHRGERAAAQLGEAEPQPPAGPPPESVPGTPTPRPQSASPAPRAATPAALTPEEKKRQRRELMARKLAAATGRRVPSRRPGAASSAPPGSNRPGQASEPVRPEVARQHALRGLAASLKGVARLTGGVDRLQRQLDMARKAEADNDLIAAANGLRLAVALAPERPDLQREYERVRYKLAVQLAANYEKQARYEERSARWGEAAASWGRVCEGRPRDAEAHTRAAHCLLQAGGDLRRAKELAEKAVELGPQEASTHRVLGRVFQAAGMEKSARREYEVVVKLDPADEMVKNLLRELSK